MTPTLRQWKAYIFQRPLSRTSFLQRLVGDSIIWGPLLLIWELIWSGTYRYPKELPGVLVVAVPFVLINVAWLALLEHLVCAYIRRRREQKQP
jgi:hypothetical protein